MPSADLLPPAPDRAPDFLDDFTDGVDPRRWVAHYLPHWTTPERSAARYRIVADGLELRIDEDQLDWRPEDAPLRVSNLQTGTFSGALDSDEGTHRHRDDGLAVRTRTPTCLLFAPASGRVDITVAAGTDDGTMLAAWLVGTEHLSPEDSGEICIFEIDAEAVGATTTARCGTKAHGDPRLVTDMVDVTLAFDARTPHTWSVIWDASGTTIGCRGEVVRRMPHAPDYPMFLMIDLFETGPRGGMYPKTATVRGVRGWEF